MILHELQLPDAVQEKGKVLVVGDFGFIGHELLTLSHAYVVLYFIILHNSFYNGLICILLYCFMHSHIFLDYFAAEFIANRFVVIGFRVIDL